MTIPWRFDLKIESIRSHLVGFNIVGKRRTTIAHAFASALAPAESYRRERVEEALQILGQKADDIRCVYCGAPAETWDHLVGLVSESKFSGYGHVLGNLVPCCKFCNSAKGNKDWQKFLRQTHVNDSDYDSLVVRIKQYQREYGAPGILYEEIRAVASTELAAFEQIQAQVLDLMRQADDLAVEIRRRLPSSPT